MSSDGDCHFKDQTAFYMVIARACQSSLAFQAIRPLPSDRSLASAVAQRGESWEVCRCRQMSGGPEVFRGWGPPTSVATFSFGGSLAKGF